MLDIRFIRENPELVAEKSKQKGYDVDVSRLIKLDDRRRELLQQLEANQATINHASKDFQDTPPNEAQRKTLQQTKELITKIQDEVRENNGELFPLVFSVPNIFPDDTPLGGEENNKQEKTWGDTAAKDFEGIDHLTWGEQRGLIDFERGAKVAGNKFYYLKGSLVELELAVIQLGMDLAKKHGFTPMAVPHMVNSRMIEGTGFAAHGDEKQIYKIEGEDLNLIATAEIPMTGYHADETLAEKDLPVLYAGISPAYRMEAGAYGQHAKGLFRTHQFNKLELYVFCKPEESEQWHKKLIELEEEMCQTLEIPYRLVRIAAGDLGAPAYKKFDVEYWSPADKAYRELMSCSNVTDYQARRLNIRYKNAAGETAFVHTLNGTLAAMSRIPIALIENHQTKDGKVQIPKTLQKYMSGQTEI